MKAKHYISSIIEEAKKIPWTKETIAIKKKNVGYIAYHPYIEEVFRQVIALENKHGFKKYLYENKAEMDLLTEIKKAFEVIDDDASEYSTDYLTGRIKKLVTDQNPFDFFYNFFKTNLILDILKELLVEHVNIIENLRSSLEAYQEKILELPEEMQLFYDNLHLIYENYKLEQENQALKDENRGLQEACRTVTFALKHGFALEQPSSPAVIMASLQNQQVKPGSRPFVTVDLEVPINSKPLYVAPAKNNCVSEVLQVADIATSIPNNRLFK